MQEVLEKYQLEVTQELENILEYWQKYTVDNEFGGFYGKINDEDTVVPFSEKGSVLNARILWTFSAAYRNNPKKEYLEVATRAYQYLQNHFNDKVNGGVYWSVDYLGNPSNTRKQIYGQAFVIYGLSEYYKITQNPEALNWAIELFDLIEKNSFDSIYGGYLEALTLDWKLIEDLKLSQKDANEPKSMNTHLHILEAYSTLYGIWKNDLLKQKMKGLIEVFLKYIINPTTGNQYLFLDNDWTIKSSIISYGHDIEAAWLLYEASEILGDEALIQKTHQVSVKMAKTTMKGFTADGGLTYETEGNHHDTDKHWWVQAESMVGYFNAFQLSNDEKYLQQSIKSWEFIQQYLITPTGEWRWATQGEINSPMPNQDKAGFWKCPYHNARACLEVMSRIKSIKMVSCVKVGIN
jgi:cellobiose epimerase